MTMINKIHALPAALRPIAARWARSAPATKAAAQADIRAAADRGGLTLDAARRACEAAAEQARAIRRARAELRAAARLGYCPVDPARHRGAASIHPLASWASERVASYRGCRCSAAELRTPTRGTPAPASARAILPSGTPAQRLAAARSLRLENAYRSAYRVATHGSIEVITTTSPAAVGIRQTEDLDWQGYSKSTKYPMRLQHTLITAPADWRARVQRRGLAMIDGMLTLDAAPLDAPSDIDLYAATWLVQGRGTTTAAVRGYIACSDGRTYHADTAAAALAGLGRKIKRAQLDAEMTALIESSSLHDLVARAPASAVVRLADARAVGACEYGIQSWCHSTGLPYEAGAAPLTDVMAAWQCEPRHEARAAILHALRRCCPGASHLTGKKLQNKASGSDV